jgi:hypothetical protein
VESTAKFGNWEDSDQKQVTVLKLTETARAFYLRNRDLRSTTITWEAFKAKFLEWFRDVPSEQYHASQLYRARQRKDESDKSEIIEPVLILYAEIFHDEENNDFKSTKIIEHRIETGDSPSIKKAPYKVPFALRQEMNRQVQTMLDKGVIRPSHSPWSSPVILIREQKPEISFLC